MRKALFILLLTCAPAGAKGRPDWVDGQSSKYPKERYLVGVGIADDRQTAEDRGRGEISKIFSTLVTVNTNVSESETNTQDSSGKSGSFAQSVSQNLQTVSQKALEGVEIEENWQDPATKQQYALAVLERAKAINAVNDKISDFDHQAQSWKSQMESATDKLPRVKAAMRLLTLLKARAELANDLRVLDLSGKASPSPFDEGTIRAQAAKAIAELDVVVDIR